MPAFYDFSRWTWLEAMFLFYWKPFMDYKYIVFYSEFISDVELCPTFFCCTQLRAGSFCFLVGPRTSFMCSCVQDDKGTGPIRSLYCTKLLGRSVQQWKHVSVRQISHLAKESRSIKLYCHWLCQLLSLF